MGVLHHCLRHFNFFNREPIVAEKSVFKTTKKVAATAAKRAAVVAQTTLFII